MEGEKKRSKGGFFQLFEWSGKSRKKLFSQTPELTGGSTQGNDVETSATMGLHVIDVDSKRGNSVNSESLDFSCASSVTSDDAYGSRAPGVVAKLMGLDSLPTSNVVEPSSTSAPFVDPRFPGESQYSRNSPHLWSEPMGHLNISNRHEKNTWNSADSRLRKVQNRPIDRFQTESLPPKSAKPIPITHHKLLSPIKSPAFIPKRNVAYIVEAAAKIIEASPKATNNGRVPSIGSSSVPLRIRDLKQKIEAAHTVSRPPRLGETNVAKGAKGLHNDKSPHRLEGTSSSIVSFGKGSSNNSRNKAKSAPPAVHARLSVQDEGHTARSIGYMKHKGQNEVKSNKSIKSQPEVQRAVRKGNDESRNINVLRQNNQKQNSVSNRYGSTSKSSNSNRQDRKAQSTGVSVQSSRTARKVTAKPETISRKKASVATSEKERISRTSWEILPVNGDLHIDTGVRPVKYNVATDGFPRTAHDKRKCSMDVISFTFTSPIKGTTPDSQSTGQILGKSDRADIDASGRNDHTLFRNIASSFSGLNIIGGDALGVLLEQKLKELACKVESSNCNVIRDESNYTPQERSFQPTSDGHQLPEEMDKHSNGGNNSPSRTELDNQCCSPVSSVELSSNGQSSSTSGTKQSLMRHAPDMFDWISTNESVEMEGDAEVSDTASSISMDVERKFIMIDSIRAESKQSYDWEWELDYVKDMLQNIELKPADFVLAQTSTFINPNLFDQLESQKDGTGRSGEDYRKFERKVVFDCIWEWLQLMSKQAFGGGCKAWAKLGTLFDRKSLLAVELHKEILGWKSMGELMVDELVDRDMSTKYGRWLDFDIEAFDEGVDIEKGILTSLINEVISDLLLL